MKTSTLIILLVLGGLACAVILFWNYCAHKNDPEDEL